MKESGDSASASHACNMLSNILRFNSIMYLFFINDIMWKPKIIIGKMQEEQFNILDAVMAVDCTIKSLRRMNENEMNQNGLIEAAVLMSKYFSFSPVEAFDRFNHDMSVTT